MKISRMYADFEYKKMYEVFFTFFALLSQFVFFSILFSITPFWHHMKNHYFFALPLQNSSFLHMFSMEGENCFRKILYSIRQDFFAIIYYIFSAGVDGKWKKDVRETSLRLKTIFFSSFYIHFCMCFLNENSTYLLTFYNLVAFSRKLGFRNNRVYENYCLIDNLSYLKKVTLEYFESCLI